MIGSIFSLISAAFLDKSGDSRQVPFRLFPLKHCEKSETISCSRLKSQFYRLGKLPHSRVNSMELVGKFLQLAFVYWKAFKFFRRLNICPKPRFLSQENELIPIFGFRAWLDSPLCNPGPTYYQCFSAFNIHICRVFRHLKLATNTTFFWRLSIISVVCWSAIVSVGSSKGLHKNGAPGSVRKLVFIKKILSVYAGVGQKSVGQPTFCQI